MPKFVVPSVLLFLLTVAAPARGQTAGEESPWSGTASVGLAFTSGNKDSSTFNAGYDVTYDPGAKNVVKSDALYIRGETDGAPSTDRLAWNARDQFQFHDGFFVFGQTRYLRDRFKEIDYLVAPTAGLGYQIFDTEATSLTLDAGAGGVWERNTGRGVQSSGAVTLDQKLEHQLTPTTAVRQTVSALWRTEDFSDALFTFGASISVSMTTRTQIKLEWVDTYKNRPPVKAVQKNDMSVLIGFVFKN
jgi:putative salt-induced outer membrane protein YdiY